MTRGESCAALFPYTTLFRSHLAEVADRELAALGDQRRGELVAHVRRCLRVAVAEAHLEVDAVLAVELALLRDRQRGPELILDRKSTRLNSSHANISYAVFCL